MKIDINVKTRQRIYTFQNAEEEHKTICPKDSCYGHGANPFPHEYRVTASAEELAD